MAQLKMFCPAQPLREMPIPAGCTVKNFDREEEIAIWVDICKNGILRPEDGVESFERTIRNCPDLCPEEDLFFVLCDGEYAATIAAIYHPDRKIGHVHMVTAKPEFRGRGIGNWMTYLALKHIYEKGKTEVRYTFLTTDDFRKPAVRSYLKAGFLPVDYEPDMQERWQKLIDELEIPETTMVDEQCSPVRRLVRG